MELTYFAALIASVPTISMLLTSFMGSNMRLSSIMEASSQNYCAGLMLGAVMKELFPLVTAAPIQDTWLGISIGFALALAFLSSLDFIVVLIETSYIETSYDRPKAPLVHRHESDFLITAASLEAGGYYQAIGRSEDLNMCENSGNGVALIPLSPGSNRTSISGTGSDVSEDDIPIMQLTSQATSVPAFRDSIVLSVTDLALFIQGVQGKSAKLLSMLKEADSPNLQPKGEDPSSSSSSYRNNGSSGSFNNNGSSGSYNNNNNNNNNSTISQTDVQHSSSNTTKLAEILADQIDQDIHQLQYIVDRNRRMLQGAGSDIEGCVPRIWIDENQGLDLQEVLSELNQLALTVSSILQAKDQLGRQNIKEVHQMFDQMDMKIDQLHEKVEDYNFKWRKKRTKITRAPIPSTGSFIPLGLMIPVVVDSIVDGFFMGSTAAISPRAGIILAVSNCLEMGFLGLAVSIRVSKCTGSSEFVRCFSLFFPPAMMLLSAVVGASVGEVSRSHASLLVGVVSFGIVALLSLVINELLVEARETMEGKEAWWTGLVFFLGIYSVIMMDLFLPTDLV